MAAKFFISRAGAEAAFAVEVAEALRKAGVETVLQDDDFGHQNFVAAMDEALREPATRVLALISPEYVASDACRAEGLAALGNDTLNRKERLIPVLVAPTAPDGLFTAIAYTSVVRERQLGETAAAVRKTLGACGFGEKPAPEPRERTQILHYQIKKQPGFTGREGELASMRRQLLEGSGAVAITALAGMGGVGKTTLAKEYAWRNRARYHGVWWIAAVSRDALTEGLIELGAKEMTGLETSNDREAAAHRCLRWIEASGAAAPWLLILDNVNDPRDLDGLTPRENAHVILTSRRGDLDRLAEPLSLEVLPEAEAVAYLCTEAGREDRAGAASLAEALGWLPLALEQAASYLRHVRTVSFADYRAKASEYLSKPHREDEQAGVAATFSLAIEQVAAKNPDAVHLLELMSFCAPNAVPLDLFVTEERDLAAVGEQAAELARWSLIRQTALTDGTPGADAHRLVQASGRARGGEERLGEALALLRAAIPDGEGENHPQDHRSWPRLERLEAHGEAALGHAPELPSGAAAEAASFVANQLGLFATAQARFAAAEPLHRRALAIREAALGKEHPDTALSLNNLAGLLRVRGALDEAEPLHRRALAIREAALGKEHPYVASSLNHLAELLRARGALDEAEPLQRRALAIWEAALGKEHPNVALSLNNLAELLRARGALDEAEPLYRRALAILEAALGPEHPNVAVTLNNLAKLLQARGALHEAAPLFRRALAIFEAALPAEHPNVATVRENLASLEREMATRRAEDAQPEVAAAPILDEEPRAERPVAPASALAPVVAKQPEVERLAEPEAAAAEEPTTVAEAIDPAPAPARQAPPKRKRGFFARLFGRDRAG